MFADEEQLSRGEGFVKQGEIKTADLRFLSLEEARESGGQQNPAGERRALPAVTRRL
jgi:hypothetical protein